MKKIIDYVLYVKESGKLKRLDTRDILFIEAQRDYVRIQTKAKNFTTHITLKKMLELLPATMFVQVHRSFIVRFDAISEIECNMSCLTMNNVNNINIPIGDIYRKTLEDKLVIF
jgi:two-component system LytT family response regulator